MISLASKTKFDSKVFPGVTFHIRKYTEGIRHELRRLCGSSARRLNEASAELMRLRESIKPDSEISDEQRNELAEALENVYDIQYCEIQPAYVRIAFVSADGIQIDGHPLTAEDVIHRCPKEFYDEVYAAIEGEYGLTERQKGESEPLSTCTAAVDGGKSLTSAESASGKDTTSQETVIDTSLSK